MDAGSCTGIVKGDLLEQCRSASRVQQVDLTSFPKLVIGRTMFHVPGVTGAVSGSVHGSASYRPCGTSNAT